MDINDYENKDKKRGIKCTVFEHFIELDIFDDISENTFYFTYEEFDELSKLVLRAKNKVKKEEVDFYY